MPFLLWNCRLITMITLSYCCIRSRASLFASTLWHPCTYKERQRLFRNMPGNHWGKEEVWLCPYSTSALERWWVASATPRPLYPRERDSLPIVQEAKWALGSGWKGPENIATTGFESRAVQPVARRYTNWAIPLVPIRMNIRITNLSLVNLRSPKLPLLNIFFHFSSPIFVLRDSPMSLLIRSL